MKKQVKNELAVILGLAALSLFATKRTRSLAAIPALGAAGLLLAKNKKETFADQSVIITGGSRGLGFALAQEFLKEGAHVTLIARDPDELARAQEKLSAMDLGYVDVAVCDITNFDQVKRVFREIHTIQGRIDLLINNAGAISVGPWEDMTAEDFEAQMNLHVHAVIHATREVLPYLREEISGKRIVNICSMGGRVAVPHMLPYDTSKFALSGFSQGVGAELASEGISVTTIYPTLMRTGSPIQAVFKGDHEKEFAWFQSFDVMPGLSISAPSAAKQILEAARERRWELMPSLPAKARMVAASFFPELMGQLMIFMNSLMPGGHSKEYKTGAQSRALFDRNKFTKMLKGSALIPEQELNQEPKSTPKYNLNLH